MICFLFISPEGSPSRQGISETEFMERIRERMAQEVGGYVSILVVSNWSLENLVHEQCEQHCLKTPISLN